MHESLNSFPLLQKCTNNLKGPANTNQVPPLLLLLDNNGSLSSGKKPYLSTVYAYFPLSKLVWSRAALGTATFLALLEVTAAPVGIL